MKAFFDTFWRALVLAVTGGLWEYYGELRHSSLYGDDIILIFAVAMTTAVVVMIAGDRTEMTTMRDKLDAAVLRLQLIALQRERRSAPRAPKRITGRVVSSQAGRTQMSAQSEDVKNRQRLDTFKLKFQAPPRHWMWGGP